MTHDQIIGNVAIRLGRRRVPDRRRGRNAAATQEPVGTDEPTLAQKLFADVPR